MIKRLLLSPLLALLALLALCKPVSAHAVLVRSEPSDGASLGVAPQQLRMWFSEPVALGFTTLDLVDGDGRHVAVRAHGDAASLALAVRAGEGAGTALLIVDLPKLAPNVYRLSWRTLSNNDLHTTQGALVFGVGRSADHTTAAVTAPAPAPLEVALRWLNFAGIAMLVGALAIVLILTEDERRRTKDAAARLVAGEQMRPAADLALLRLLRLALGSALLALAAGCALLLGQALAAGGTAAMLPATSLVQIVGGTSYGLAWALRQGVLAALLATLVLRRRPRSSFAPRALWLSLMLALAIAQAFQSHATAFDTFSPLRVLADALHVLAAGLWSGGVLALAVAVVPMLRHGAEEAAIAWTLLLRFGALAAAALAALLVTGLFMTGQQVASLDALLTTFYGWTLMLKVGLVLGVALLGLRNSAVLHPRIAAALRRRQEEPGPATPQIGRLARTVSLEALGGLLLLLLVAVLSASQPARGPAFDPPAEATPIPAQITNAGDLIVTLAIKPNQPGRNFVGLGVFNTRRPAPAPIEAVTIRLRAPGADAAGPPLAAASLGGGRYQLAGSPFDSAGDWQVQVTIARPHMPDTTATLPWTILSPAPAPRPLLISNRPLAPVLTPAALLLATLLLGAAVTLLFRRATSRYTRALAEWLSRWRSGAASAPEGPLPAEERIPR